LARAADIAAELGPAAPPLGIEPVADLLTGVAAVLAAIHPVLDSVSRTALAEFVADILAGIAAVLPPVPTIFPAVGRLGRGDGGQRGAGEGDQDELLHRILLRAARARMGEKAGAAGGKGRAGAAGKGAGALLRGAGVPPPQRVGSA